MQSVTENKLTRQQKLKIWFIETSFDRTKLAALAGYSKQALSQALFYSPACNPKFRKLCLSQGIPDDLLPPAQRKKADLLAENLELRQRLAALEGQSAP